MRIPAPTNELERMMLDNIDDLAEEMAMAIEASSYAYGCNDTRTASFKSGCYEIAVTFNATWDSYVTDDEYPACYPAESSVDSIECVEGFDYSDAEDEVTPAFAAAYERALLEKSNDFCYNRKPSYRKRSYCY